MPRCQETMKLTRMSTRHSVIVPSSSVITLMSLIQAPLMPLTLFETFFRPCCTASSKPFFEAELISMTFATVLMLDSMGRGAAQAQGFRGLPDYGPGRVSIEA